MNYSKELLNYTISFCVGLFIITYLIGIPYIVTGEPKIVKEYYIENFTTNVPLDYLFVLLYLCLSLYIIHKLQLENDLTKLIVVGITTAILTGGFYLYFTAYQKTNNFFSRWFHTVGYKSIIYDVILLCFIYYVYLLLSKKLH
tara:strand:- start:939 stop:1367 length:429 start_codon:yes stop_codon:yes gene_type:complete